MLGWYSHAAVVVMVAMVSAESLSPAPLYVARHVRDIGPNKPCIDIHELRHGQAVCDASGCRLRCRPGYLLLASELLSEAYLSCDASRGELLFRGVAWRPEMTLCAPHCPGGCHNGGECAAPGQCRCRGPWGGPTCGEERPQGDDPGAGGQLAANQRRVDCEEGTQMPDGATSALLEYRDGHWYYSDGRVLLGVDQVTCHKVAPSKPDNRPKPTARPEPTSPSLSNKPRSQSPDRVRHTPTHRPDPFKLTSNSRSFEEEDPHKVFPRTADHPSESRRSHRISEILTNPSHPSSFEVKRNRKRSQDSSRSSAVQRLPQPSLGRPSRQQSRLMPSRRPQEETVGWTEWQRFNADHDCDFPTFTSELRATAVPSGRGLRFECAPGRRTLDNRDWVTVTCHDGVWYRTTGLPLQEHHVRCY